jgi:hypothetical protein
VPSSIKEPGFQKGARRSPLHSSQRLRFAVTLLICVAAIYLPLAVAAYFSNATTDTDRKAAVLISGHAVTDHDHWLPPIALAGSYAAWTLYFNARDLKVKYFLSASRSDFINVLCSDTYQSIVLVGHGTYNSWRATDGYINNWDILALKERFHRKDGEWFQLTCSTRDFSPVSMGELVMKSGRVFYYQGGNVKGYDLILDALFGFRHIKDETFRSRSSTKVRLTL